MRISDWSSDVCSSDLQDPKPSRRPYFHQTDSRSRHSPPTAQSPPSPAPPLAADPQSPTFPSAPPVKAHSRSTPPRARHYRPAAHPVHPAWPPHRWHTPAYRPAQRRQAARFPHPSGNITNNRHNSSPHGGPSPRPGVISANITSTSAGVAYQNS